MTRVVIIEHQESCPPALVGDWLAAAGADVQVVRPYRGDALPDVTSYDAMVVLGGEMSANDDKVAWLGPLKAELRDLVRSGEPLLGICLGHQLIASALGGRVEKNPAGQRVGLQRIGWVDDVADDEVFGGHTGAERCVHWNGDVVSVLPNGAEVLASGPEADPQVVRFAPLAWGIQAHPEVTVDVVRRWAESDRDDHVARGIDQELVLADIEAARDELVGHWQPVVTRFVEVAAR